MIAVKFKRIRRTDLAQAVGRAHDRAAKAVIAIEVPFGIAKQPRRAVVGIAQMKFTFHNRCRF